MLLSPACVEKSLILHLDLAGDNLPLPWEW